VPPRTSDPAARSESRPGPRFAVATPHHLATEAGVEALGSGGTAVDAALAACAVLSVVYPHMCGIGGDLFALVHRPNGDVVALNGSGAAARGLDPDHVRRMSEGMPQHGPLTITVPGAVAGWETLLSLGAVLPLARALEPAIRHASEGVPVSRSLAASLAEPAVAADQGLGGVFFPGGRALRPGDIFGQPALAETLRALAAKGAAVLYAGTVGERLVEGLAERGCYLTLEDLERHRTELTAPLMGRLGEREVLTSPPNSQGFVLLQILEAAAGHGDGRRGTGAHGLDDLDPFGPGAPGLAALFAATSRDRDRHLADPRRASVPVEELLTADRIAALRREAFTAAGGPPVHRLREGRHLGDTIAVVAADAAGHAVSAIQSLYGGFGSRILEPSTGIVAHNRGALFSLDRASPNVLEGGKRPAHTLMPVMVRRNGRLEVVAGTMGGKAQPQIHAQVLYHLLGRRLAPEAAVAEPRWIVETDEPSGSDSVVLMEGRISRGLADRFRAAGLPVRTLADRDEEVGHAQLIRRTDDGFHAGSDPRADGSAAAG
jgi:oxamate amidohydrolase